MESENIMLYLPNRFLFLVLHHRSLDLRMCSTVQHKYRMDRNKENQYNYELTKENLPLDPSYMDHNNMSLLVVHVYIAQFHHIVRTHLQ